MRNPRPAEETPGEERQLLLLRAANAASRLEPEALPPAEIAAALGELRGALADLRAAFVDSADDPVATMARWEIGRVLAEAEPLEGAPPDLANLRRIGAVRHRALGMLLGLDRALAAQGMAPLLESIADRERRRALAVRAALVSFRDEVRALGEPPRGEMRPHLERIAILLQRLREAQGLRRLRLGDRGQVENLHERVVAALGDGGGEAAALWRDVSAFAELALEVNQRPDLREHDGALARSLAVILAARPAALESFSFRRRLLRLRGRDEGLDRLLAEGGAATTFRERLEAIAAALEA